MVGRIGLVKLHKCISLCNPARNIGIDTVGIVPVALETYLILVTGLFDYTPSRCYTGNISHRTTNLRRLLNTGTLYNSMRIVAVHTLNVPIRTFRRLLHIVHTLVIFHKMTAVLFELVNQICRGDLTVMAAKAVIFLFCEVKKPLLAPCRMRLMARKTAIIFNGRVSGICQEIIVGVFDIRGGAGMDTGRPSEYVMALHTQIRTQIGRYQKIPVSIIVRIMAGNTLHFIEMVKVKLFRQRIRRFYLRIFVGQPGRIHETHRVVIR